MATRLDKVSRIARPERREERERTPTTVRQEAAPPVDAERHVESGATEVPAARLTQATGVWLGLTFLLSYFLLPGVSAMLGTGGSGIFAFWPQYPAFLLVGAYVVSLVALTRPQIRVGGPSRDPVLAASLGSLGVWALLQQTLLPFGLMSTTGLVSLLLINVVESVMLGTMLASFTDRAGRAFTLGAGFQLALYVFSLVILGLAL